MQILCLVILFVGVVFSQTTELVDDPGLYSLSGNQCSTENAWHFRSDYLWNDTGAYVNSRCSASFEIPTPVKPGISKGTQTNINKAVIPTLPTVTGGIDGWTQSAAVVDMNSPCRAALWVPFTLTKDNAQSVTIRLKLWVRSNDQIQQRLLDEDSEVPGAELLQYLHQPYGLLGEDLNEFPPIVEETNQIRIDILSPDDDGEFYDRAFSLIDDHIVANIPIPNFQDGNVVPANGTNGAWIQVDYTATNDLQTAGTYALRIASAQSQIGVSWGVSDVHITTQGGVRKRHLGGLYEVESAAEEIFGTVAHILPNRMSRF